MSAHCWHRKVVRAFIVVPAGLLTLCLASGCGAEGYPEELTYPVRTDPIVIAPLPTENPIFLDSPGQLSELMSEFRAKGGKTVDPLMSGELEQAHRLQDELKSKSGSERDDMQKKIEGLEKKVNKWQQAWSKLSPKLDDALAKRFGRPAAPAVEDAPEASSLLKLDKDTLVKGSRLYRQQCLHCHGLTGDGRGPTGPWVNPHPRDYRKGTFKFTTTMGGNDRKPLREDIVQTLMRGIDGTSMPSFSQLAPESLEQMASYVIHLSIRGETEAETIKAIQSAFDEDRGDVDLGQLDGGGLEGQVKASQDLVAGRWVASQSKHITPAKFPYNEQERAASIARGYTLFTAPGAASCISCHVDYGRTFSYKWDEWGTIVRPADMTAGVYRGGRAAVDIYFRMHTGINGVGMPAFARESGGSLDANQLWDLVNFIQALPYPQMLEKADPKIREAIYSR